MGLQSHNNLPCLVNLKVKIKSQGLVFQSVPVDVERVKWKSCMVKYCVHRYYQSSESGRLSRVGFWPHKNYFASLFRLFMLFRSKNTQTYLFTFKHKMLAQTGYHLNPSKAVNKRKSIAPKPKRHSDTNLGHFCAVQKTATLPTFLLQACSMSSDTNCMHMSKQNIPCFLFASRFHSEGFPQVCVS